MLQRTVKFYGFETPSICDRTDVENAIQIYGPLAKDDMSFLRHTDDLITLTGDKERTKVHDFLEKHFFSAGRATSRVARLNASFLSSSNFD